jgi:hypothetical protein
MTWRADIVAVDGDPPTDVTTLDQVCDERVYRQAGTPVDP